MYNREENENKQPPLEASKPDDGRGHSCRHANEAATGTRLPQGFTSNQNPWKCLMHPRCCSLARCYDRIFATHVRAVSH